MKFFSWTEGFRGYAAETLGRGAEDAPKTPSPARHSPGQEVVSSGSRGPAESLPASPGGEAGSVILGVQMMQALSQTLALHTVLHLYTASAALVHFPGSSRKEMRFPLPTGGTRGRVGQGLLLASPSAPTPAFRRDERLCLSVERLLVQSPRGP